MQNIRGFLGSVQIGDYFPVRVMGAINLTRNSFYPGSVKRSAQEIVETAIVMTEEGADVIDLGARSTAPYRKYEISPEKEKNLLANAVRLLQSRVNIPISADTTRLESAKAALREGASIINDVYGLD